MAGELKKLKKKGLVTKALLLRAHALSMQNLIDEFEAEGYEVEVVRSHVLSIHLQRGSDYDEDKMVQIIGPNNVEETDLVSD